MKVLYREPEFSKKTVKPGEHVIFNIWGKLYPAVYAPYSVGTGGLCDRCPVHNYDLGKCMYYCLCGDSSPDNQERYVFVETEDTL